MITTPAEIVNMIYTDLNTWAGENAGVAALTHSPYDLLETLSQRPSGWRLTIHWEGDAPADSRARDVQVLDNRIRIILDGTLGPTVTPKINLIRTTAARTPFLDLIAQVRDRVLSYRFEWLSEPNNRLRYRGTDDKVSLPDGYAIAAYNLLFDLYSVIGSAADGRLISFERST